MPVETDPTRKIFDHAHERGVQPLPPGVGAGARVLVRGRAWTLETCDAHDDCEQLHLTSLENDRSLVILWPFDRPSPRHHPSRVRALRLRAWLRHTCALAASDRPLVHLLTGNRTAASRTILAYQLAPALAVAAGAARVLLADEVGLGKTVQAGWIIDDAIAHRPDARILIAVPAGIRMQWRRELERLFGIDASSVDARWLLRTINSLPAGVSVWAPPGVYIVSLDFLKQHDISALALGVTWDLLVVDEAHVAVAPTERHKAVDAIARRSRTVVLITATPFSGDEAGFSSLMSTGAAGDSPPPLMFRRSRTDVGDSRRRRHRFVRVRMTRSEQRLQRLLDRYCREIWTHAPTPEGRLAAIVLRKRALSSAAALGRSLRRRQRLLAAPAAAATQLTLFGDDTDDDDDEPGRLLGIAGLANPERERRWLERLAAAAGRAADSDSKLEYLRRLLRRTGDEPAVIFTEFRDTLADLAGMFPAALRLHGGMSTSERDDVQARFNSEGGRLFATDAASHGLNLQRRCRLVVNFELPWNPARLEQRIGRVDRMGQPHVVHAATLVARDTAEDLVIANIARRLARVARTLGPKDRLAAFLDDARIAGMAIGGDAVPDLTADGEAAPAAVPDAVLAEAARLARSSGPARLPIVRFEDVAVSSVRASAVLRAGFVAVVQWTLAERTGRVRASRTLFLHIPASPRKPSTAAEARHVADAAIAEFGQRLANRARSEVRATRDSCLAAHAQAIESRINREMEIDDRASASGPSQPGLFDRRAVDGVAPVENVRDGTRAETSRRVAQIQASASLEEHADIRGLLIVWK